MIVKTDNLEIVRMHRESSLRNSSVVTELTANVQKKRRIGIFVRVLKNLNSLISISTDEQYVERSTWYVCCFEYSPNWQHRFVYVLLSCLVGDY